jgi:hypothetical protein
MAVMKPADSLTLLLTAETLLFAAFSVIMLLSSPVPGGRNIKPLTAWLVALAVASVLSFVALGAFLAWWQVFIDCWPKHWFARIEAIAAAAGIAVQPIIVGVLWWAGKP